MVLLTCFTNGFIDFNFQTDVLSIELTEKFSSYSVCTASTNRDISRTTYPGL